MFADLHVHTYFSDGSQSPEEVAEAARDKGISVISVCDHNTISAYKRLLPACREAGIQLIQGAEIDVYWENERLHLLAYHFDPDNEAMDVLLRKSRAELDEISVVLIKEMEKDFPDISFADFQSYEPTLGRGGWKGIQYLYDRGLSENVIDGMKYYGRYGHYHPDFYTIQQACEVIRQAGGVPVLAHPGVYWQDKGRELADILDRLSSTGLQGLECYYPWHNGGFTSLCVDFCKNNDFRITCGCDGHGSFGHEVMGVVYDIGIMKVDMGLLDLKGIY